MSRALVIGFFILIWPIVAIRFVFEFFFAQERDDSSTKTIQGTRLVTYYEAVAEAERLDRAAAPTPSTNQAPSRATKRWWQPNNSSLTENPGHVQATQPAPITPTPATQSPTLAEQRLHWAGLSLKDGSFRTHYAAIGVPGSGKTRLLLKLMSSIVPTITRKHPTEDRKAHDARCLVWDVKNEFIGHLRSMGASLDDSIIITNPMDQRAHAWAIHKDITHLDHAGQLAENLLDPPREAGPNSFFYDAARVILTSTIYAFISIMRAQKRVWTLRDIILALREPDQLRQILEQCPAAWDPARGFFAQQRERDLVLTTIRAKMERFAQVAAIWHRITLEHPDRTFSIVDWVGTNRIIVLGNSQRGAVVTKTLNRLLFRLSVENLLDGESDASKTENRRSWILLDELRFAGNLDKLNALLTLGRAYGVRCVITCQDVSGLQAADAFEKNAAEEILSMCGNLAILRVNGPTARWAEERIGRAICDERTRSVTTNKDGESEGVQQHLQERSPVMASEFQELEEATKTTTHGYFLVEPIRQVFRAAVDTSWPEVVTNPEPNSAPWDEKTLAEIEALPLWSATEAAVLKLSAVVGEAAAPPQPAKPDNDLIEPSWMESGD